jgi:hypothetical protein
MARKVTGHPVPPESNEAVCFCVMGALARCYPVYTKRFVLEEVIRERVEKAISEWNDSNSTTHEDVIRILKELDI